MSCSEDRPVARARRRDRAGRRATVLTITLGLAAAMVAPATWAQGLLRDDRGVEQRFSESPRRIVSLLPSLTESVCALGACDRLVGTDRYSNWPSEVAALPKLGGLDDAVVERIVALRPDVVLAASSTRAVARLESLGLRVLAFDSERHEQVRSTLQRLGTLLGEPQRAEVLWQRLQLQMDEAAGRVPTALRGRSVYFEADATPYAAGEASFVGQTLSRLGLVNIAAAAMGPFPRLNPEFVVRSQPHLVIALQRNAQDMPARPGWAGLSALREGRVCALEPARYEVLVRPGPRLGEAALHIADCLVDMQGRTGAPASRAGKAVR